MITIIIVLLIPLVVFIAWNGWTNYKLLKLRSSNETELNDSKYFELKFKMQFLVAMFTVFAGLGSFYGYTTLEGAKVSITKEIQESIDSLNLRIRNASIEVSKRDSIVENLNYAIFQMTNSVPQLKSRTQLIEKRILDINQKNILKQSYYIIPEITFQPGDKPKTYFFKDFTTNLGDKLPQFKTPPLVLPIQEGNMILHVINITTESFQIGYSAPLLAEGSIDPFSGEIPYLRLSILILEK